LARLVSLVDAGPAPRLAAAGKLATEFGRNRDGVYFALELWTTWWRDVFLVQAGAEDLVANCDQMETLRGHAAGCTAAQARAYLVRIEDALAQLEQNVNPRLALEALLLNIPRVHIQSTRDKGLAPLADVPG
jgi:DNA polymerase-3 subunit delta'